MTNTEDLARLAARLDQAWTNASWNEVGAVLQELRALAESARGGAAKLTADARIGGTVFRKGVSERCLINRAIKEQEWHLNPPLPHITPEDIAKLGDLKRSLDLAPEAPASEGGERASDYDLRLFVLEHAEDSTEYFWSDTDLPAPHVEYVPATLLAEARATIAERDRRIADLKLDANTAKASAYYNLIKRDTATKELAALREKITALAADPTKESQ